MEEKPQVDKKCLEEFKTAVLVYITDERNPVQKEVIVNLFAKLHPGRRRKAVAFAAKYGLRSEDFPASINRPRERRKNDQPRESFFKQFKEAVEQFRNNPTHRHFLIFLLISTEMMRYNPNFDVEQCVRETVKQYAEHLGNYVDRLEQIKQQLIEIELEIKQKKAQKLSKRHSWHCFVKSPNS